MTLYEKYCLKAADAFRRRELARMSDAELFAHGAALFAQLNQRLNALSADCPPQGRERRAGEGEARG